MTSRLNASSLGWVGILAAVVYYGWGSSADAGLELTSSALQPQRVSSPDNQVAVKPQGTAFPWLVADSGQADWMAQAGGSSRQKVEGLLHRYQSGAALPDEKRQIQLALHAFKQDPAGRGLLVELLTASSQATQAQALYGLIRDADFKDVTLLEDLIQRDRGVFDVATQARILDLIADLEAQSDADYSAAIDQYLTQLAQSRDADLRHAATAQRIWYVAHHQPDSLAKLGTYLQDRAQSVREEMYSLLESRMNGQTLSRASEWTAALTASLGSDHLSLSAEEKARVGALLATLQHL